MSVEAVLARMTELQGVWNPPVAKAAPAATPSTSPSTGGADTSSFSSLLSQATGTDGSAAALRSAAVSSPLGGGLASQLGVAGLGAAGVAGPSGVGATGATAAGTAGDRMIALAQGELAAGVAEQPDGSNDSPRIAEYRSATTPSPVGPWCSYFVSWLANRAGVPVGEAGQGFASVDALHRWAQRTGRTTQTPAAGELIVWDEHIGLVTGVDADGTIHTIEGNSGNKVSARTYGPDGGGALTYVKLG